MEKRPMTLIPSTILTGFLGADKILLSKTDLVDAAALETLKARIRHINPRAPISTSDFGRVPIADVLDLRGFNLNDKLELDPAFLTVEEADAHDHDHDHDHDH